MAQQTRRIIQYRVRQGDSLERLALRFLGDAADWLQLALLNGLDYPYVSDDATFVRNVPATGQVVFTRVAGTTGNITIPAAYQVIAPATTSAPAKTYTVDTLTTLPNGQDTVSANVTSTQAGEIGNTPGLTINTLTTSITNLSGVSNPLAITGGAFLNVKIPGEMLLLFTDQDGLAESATINTEALSKQDFFASLLGVDLTLGQDGDLTADSRGGLGLTAGIENFRQAILRRFGTPLAWYAFNPGYGSAVEESIGQRGDDYWLQRTRIEAERTVRSDPRTADVQNIQVKFSAGALAISMDILAIGEKDPRNLVVAFAVPSGG